MNTEILDIILFGASGYTGKYCIKEVHRLAKSNGRLLTWGIAGRSEAKLKAALNECQKQLVDEDLSNVPIIIANIEDSDSLISMTSRAKVIINCCGPYRFYGEPIVKACIETGTHQVDVTGEPQYIEYIQLKYDKAAREKGIYIISSCGFDCIPGDLGVIFLQQNFKGVLNSVETYLHVTKDDANKGPSFNYATWESLVHGIADAKQLSKIRRELYATPMPRFKPQLKQKPTIHKTDIHDGWAVPFVGADRSVIYRTQRYLYENENMRPAQIQTYEVVDSLPIVMAMAFYGSIFKNLVKSKLGQQLLLKYPAIFSGGMFSHRSPSEKAMDNTKFSLIFRGEGWDEKSVAASTDNDIVDPLNKTVITYVSGYNPAYKLTAITVTLAAITTITETDKLPKGGGVYSPGAAFAKTSLLQQLQSNGLDYKIKSKL